MKKPRARVAAVGAVLLAGMTGGVAETKDAEPQDIEWSIAAALPSSLQPPDGMMYPNEIHLAGPRTLVAGEPLRCWLRAAPPAVPVSYDGTSRRVELDPKLRVELVDAAGHVLAVERPEFPGAKVFAANRPAYYDVEWQPLALAAAGLAAGDYTVVAWIDAADGIPHSRLAKRLRVVSAEEWRRLQSLVVTGEAIATAGSLSTATLVSEAGAAAGEKTGVAAIVPAGREVTIALPGEGRVAVYGIVSPPAAACKAILDGVERTVPAFTDGSYLVREQFLGVGEGGRDSLRLTPQGGDLQLAGIRVEPLPESVSFVPSPGNGGKQLVVNNDGMSEGFFEPAWNPDTVDEQVDRYKGSDVSQFEFQSNLAEVTNYRSRFVDFYGERFTGTWPTKGYEGCFRHFDVLDTQEPRLFPRLEARSRAIGVAFWGSLRMNADYGTHEFASLLHSRFQNERPEMRVMRSPNQSPPSFYLSYAQPVVRERRIGVLTELAEFGGAGVNLDFCRYPTVLGYEEPMLELFRKAHGADGAAVSFDDPRWVSVRQGVMNGFMREVRAAMDEAGRKRGQPVRISVRLPATKYETFGFDPQTWIREGLVDALIPSFPGWARWFDIAPWTAMAGGSKVEVWPGWDYYFYETASAELTDADVARGLKPGYNFILGRNDYLRRAAEAYAADADGFHMFNAWGTKHVRLTRGISDPEFVAHWRQYLDPDNLASSVRAEQ